MISADTNIFLYAANPASPHHAQAKAFFDTLNPAEFAVCEWVLVEIYMQLRNPAVLKKPLTAAAAAAFCRSLRIHPVWQHIDYDAQVSSHLWDWAANTSAGFRQIIDARIALTLLHHGVHEFATANLKDFKSFGFSRVWNPLAD